MLSPTAASPHVTAPGRASSVISSAVTGLTRDGSAASVSLALRRLVDPAFEQHDPLSLPKLLQDVDKALSTGEAVSLDRCIEHLQSVEAHMTSKGLATVPESFNEPLDERIEAIGRDLKEAFAHRERVRLSNAVAASTLNFAFGR
ncbi:uncharacterized protein L969DRAFT_88196 [Mixia osmundae IAM 14324]|uniref:Uncharacterized protein n=1 Tax=Mixia osmundae (strain CBS 9802 / IAM 14324 / JCM 22182 / KY 12970) TaxID=764103 RepID=G7E0Z9_MIXOS|nr:uncharacterized protein L969DRAFT_88196 [Mixia osmundae IAM 14324]KEI38856.1 hypothetical protein L969DRAFT_88196 [Mixia osmundae IAM 14324]GAA96509.1 hypothetical protein E5Q_03177 [Mixia osmundae IAM 14324]